MARIRIAKTGGTVYDATRLLSLDTNATSLMILSLGSQSGSVTTVAHNLGYYPIVYPFFNDGTYWHPGKSVLCGPYADTSVDTTNIYVSNNTSSYPWKYFLIGNSVNNATGTGNNNATGKLKVSKPGVNITTATDIRQYQFCSGADLFKADLSKKGTTSVTTSSSNWSPQVTINHGLGYVPFCLVTDSSLGGEVPLDYEEGYYNYFYKIDANNLYIGVVDYDHSSPQTYNFKYQIYRNKIA